jgi:hypothetical protein
MNHLYRKVHFCTPDDALLVRNILNNRKECWWWHLMEHIHNNSINCTYENGVTVRNISSIYNKFFIFCEPPNFIKLLWICFIKYYHQHPFLLFKWFPSSKSISLNLQGVNKTFKKKKYFSSPTKDRNFFLFTPHSSPSVLTWTQLFKPAFGLEWHIDQVKCIDRAVPVLGISLRNLIKSPLSTPASVL